MQELDFEEIDDDLLLNDLIEDPTKDADERYEHFRFTADKGQSQLRVDKFLVIRIEHATRNRVQLAIEAGCVKANGVAVKANYKVKPYDVVTLEMAYPRRELVIIPEDIPLDILYEDADVLVVNKPAGLVVHPGHGNYTGTLVNALAYHFRDDPQIDATDPRLGLVHRIDKNTSGLLVIAKNAEAKTHLSSQFFHRTTQRHYIALVWGALQEDSGTIEGHIGRSAKNKLQMAVFPEGDYGKHAVTHYQVIERLGYVTLVGCKLETGRTHQIRVHFKHIGHPLFNDERYGGNEILKGTAFTRYKQYVNNCFQLCPRHALHARTLGFTHPRTGEDMFFESPIPADMTQLIDKWRGYTAYRDIE